MRVMESVRVRVVSDRSPESPLRFSTEDQAFIVTGERAGERVARVVSDEVYHITSDPEQLPLPNFTPAVIAVKLIARCESDLDGEAHLVSLDKPSARADHVIELCCSLPPTLRLDGAEIDWKNSAHTSTINNPRANSSLPDLLDRSNSEGVELRELRPGDLFSLADPSGSAGAWHELLIVRENDLVSQPHTYYSGETVIPYAGVCRLVASPPGDESSEGAISYLSAAQAVRRHSR